MADIKKILSEDVFDIDSDIQIQYTKKDEDPLSKYTTQNTLLALEYATRDVVEELKKLTVENYYESMVDDRGEEWNLFHVFKVIIQGEDIYVKVRIKRLSKDIVFCISFHFAEFPMIEMPYTTSV